MLFIGILLTYIGKPVTIPQSSTNMTQNPKP